MNTIRESEHDRINKENVTVSKFESLWRESLKKKTKHRRDRSPEEIEYEKYKD